MTIRQDEKGWTHIDWELEAVTPEMLNWWWTNMEKGFALWHIGCHSGGATDMVRW